MHTTARGLRIILAVAIAIGTVSSIQAQGRYLVGARNMGMGNTGVASTTDAMSVHFNPAGMAFSKSWDLQLPLVTFDAEVEGDLVSNLDVLSDNFDLSSLNEIVDRFDNGTATDEDLSTVLDAFLYDLNALDGSQDSASLRGVSGPAFRWKNWGVSLSVIGSGALDASLDLTDGLALGVGGFVNALPNPPSNSCGSNQGCLDCADELITASGGQLDQDRAEQLVTAAGSELLGNEEAKDLLIKIVEATAQGGATLADNQSGAVVTGIVFTQFAFSYSHLIAADKLSLGTNVKLLRGATYLETTTVANLEDGEATFEDIGDYDASISSTTWGIDIGAMYRPWKNWSFGLVGNNLNKPTFDLSGNRGDVQLDPLFRAGVAFYPFKWFNVTLDADLNEVDSRTFRDFGYQYVNAGVEFNAGRWFSGWLGAYENLASDNSWPTYTAGAGFGIGRFQIALSASLATASVDLNVGEDSATFPRGVGVAFSLAWRAKRQPATAAEVTTLAGL